MAERMSADDEAKIIELFLNHTVDQIAAAIEKSRGSVAVKITRMKKCGLLPQVDMREKNSLLSRGKPVKQKPQPKPRIKKEPKPKADRTFSAEIDAAITGGIDAGLKFSEVAEKTNLKYVQVFRRYYRIRPDGAYPALEKKIAETKAKAEQFLIRKKEKAQKKPKINQPNIKVTAERKPKERKLKPIYKTKPLKQKSRPIIFTDKQNLSVKIKQRSAQQKFKVALHAYSMAAMPPGSSISWNAICGAQPFEKREKI